MPDLSAAFQAMQRRDYGAAHALLGDPLTAPGTYAVPSEWWRIRALICNAAGEVADAASAFEAGLAVLDREDGAASARLHASYGGFLINQERWWDAVEVFGHASHAARRSGDTLTRLSVAYNLAWAHLLTGEVNRAATAVEREVLAVGRRGSRSGR
ncbi:hypothetical protein [Deinococcus yunweiensis]|uniref:hypothetical protein n=1 Tax=Deinococcus yunweiensis TaxID=367282 RepID=UPI00398EA65D